MESDSSKEFDDWAKNYDESVRSRNDFPFRGYEKALEQVVTEAAVKPPCRVLDLGIGTGNLARKFLDLGCQVWGLDFSRNMLLQAQAKVPEVRMARADILGSWPDEFHRIFDRIVSAYVFHHFDLTEKIDLLLRMNRDHCTAGGRLVIADIAFSTMDALQEARIRWKEEWDDEHYWIVDEVIPACKKNGIQARYQPVDDFAGVFIFEAGTPSPQSTT